MHNLPFLSSSLGQDTLIEKENGVFRVMEVDEKPTLLQTITRIEKQDDVTLHIYGGLGTKLVLPTHMDYMLTLKQISSRQLEFSIQILHQDDTMKNYRRLILTNQSRPEEHFYGFGEQFSYTTLKGQKVPILVR